MDLFFKCDTCSGRDIWKVRVQGTRPMARTMIGDPHCPVCMGIMSETGPDAEEDFPLKTRLYPKR
jgi:hypothetical protein